MSVRRYVTLAAAAWFLVVVLLAAGLYRQNAQSRAIDNERSQRIYSVCESVNQTRSAIDQFIHSTIKVSPAETPAVQQEVRDFLAATDRNFVTRPCSKTKE